MYDIYWNAQNDQWRYALGKSGSNRLLTIGLNPSTATQEKLDTTVSKVERVAANNGFDGFIMLNLYPVRATDYEELPESANRTAYRENLNAIEEIVAEEKTPIIWAAWGESIKARPYFTEAICDLSVRLAKYQPNYLHFGPLTHAGHPRHPSRLDYSWNLAPFEISTYKAKL